jgi:hypothetical protein
MDLLLRSDRSDAQTFCVQFDRSDRSARVNGRPHASILGDGREDASPPLFTVGDKYIIIPHFLPYFASFFSIHDT